MSIVKYSWGGNIDCKKLDPFLGPIANLYGVDIWFSKVYFLGMQILPIVLMLTEGQRVRDKSNDRSY